jgi:hypothetical protein
MTKIKKSGSTRKNGETSKMEVSNESLANANDETSATSVRNVSDEINQIQAKQADIRTTEKTLTKSEVFRKLAEIARTSNFSPKNIQFNRNTDNISEVLESIDLKLESKINELSNLFKYNPHCFRNTGNSKKYYTLRSKLKKQKEDLSILQKENKESFRQYLQESLTGYIEIYDYLHGMSGDFYNRNVSINKGLTILSEIQRLIEKTLMAVNIDDETYEMRCFRIDCKKKLWDLSHSFINTMPEIYKEYINQSFEDHTTCIIFLGQFYHLLVYLNQKSIETDEDKLERIVNEWSTIFSISRN